MRDRPEADLDHAARGPELHGRRQPRAVAEVAVPHRRSIRSRGSCCTRSRYDDDGRAALDPAPRVDQRDGRAVRRSRAPLHGWKNAFDAGEWGLGRMTQPLTLGCDCLGEIHYFDATLANEQGKPWVIDERDLHARGGLRDPLEARRPVRRHAARCAAAVASSSASSQPSATTSTASSGTSTSTATSSSR